MKQSFYEPFCLIEFPAVWLYIQGDFINHHFFCAKNDQSQRCLVGVKIVDPTGIPVWHLHRRRANKIVLIDYSSDRRRDRDARRPRNRNKLHYRQRCRVAVAANAGQLMVWYAGHAFEGVYDFFWKRKKSTKNCSVK